MNGPERVVAQARTMVGVPWRHQGRKPWAVDCLGLVIVSMTAAGWQMQAEMPSGYGREPWDDALRRGLQSHFGEPVAGTWLPGDVALFRWGKAEPSHVGILADHPHGGISLIHASNRRGVVEILLAGRLLDSVIDVYRPEWPADE